MAVTTTYSWQFTQNLDLDFATGAADVTGLANGGFAGLGDHTTHIDGNIFDSDGVETDGWTSLDGNGGSLDQLANGNIVVVSLDSDNTTLFKIIDSVTGNEVVATVDLGDADQISNDVAALTGGRFAIVSTDEIGAAGGDADIDVFIRNADGSAVTSFAIDASLARDTNARVAALDNGNFAVTWQRDNGANTEIWRAVYNSAGAVVAAAALVDAAGTVNRNPDIVAINGGFGIVYEDNGWGTGTNDITLARYNSAGVFQGYTNVSNPTFINDGSQDQTPTITRLSNGMLAVAWGNNSFADTDTDVALLDATGVTRLATRNITGGESVADDVDFATLAGFGLGQLAVFQTNLTDTDIDGEQLQGVRTSTSDGASDVINGDDFIDIMNGGGGSDTLNGFNNNDVLNGQAGIDILNGGNGDDTLDGGAEADSLTGGAGFDTASYASAAGFVVVGLDPAWVNFGDAAGDTFSSVEGVVGSGFGDLIGGNGAGNLLFGGGGDDTLYGYVGADALYGGAGNDGLFGGVGGDLLDGGSDWDTARYDDAATGIVAGLSGWTNFGEAAGDVFVAVEGIFATNFADILGGDGVANALFGRGGADSLFGYGGTDFLYGGDDNDALLGGAAGDLLDGGAGSDTASYGDATGGVVAGLQGWLNFGDAAGDTYIGIENLTGTAFSDNLGGDVQANVIDGGAGADGLYGYGGFDTLIGGGGNDVFYWYAGDSGSDFIADFEGGAGVGDVLSLQGTGFTSLAQMVAAGIVVQTPATTQTEIRLAGGTIYLWNILPGGLAENDFLFV